MHVDSHRLRFVPATDHFRTAPRLSCRPRRAATATASMPCPKRFQAALQETETTEDGVKMYTWRAVRRQNLRMLRKQVRTIVLMMALLEIMRVGVVDMVYAGKHEYPAPGPADFGIAYNVGYFVAWLYMCLFALIFVPFFSWWLPSTKSDPSQGEGPSKTERFSKFLEKVNFIVIPACIAISLLVHGFWIIQTFVYTGGRPVDGTTKTLGLNSRKAWVTRVLLASGIAISMASGKIMFTILEQTELARVKPLEYLVIILPIQVNLGVLLGSAIQFKAETRRNRKLAAQKSVDTEAATVDEKRSLLVQA